MKGVSDCEKNTARLLTRLSSARLGSDTAPRNCALVSEIIERNKIRGLMCFSTGAKGNIARSHSFTACSGTPAMPADNRDRPRPAQHLGRCSPKRQGSRFTGIRCAEFLAITLWQQRGGERKKVHGNHGVLGAGKRLGEVGNSRYLRIYWRPAPSLAGRDYGKRRKRSIFWPSGEGQRPAAARGQRKSSAKEERGLRRARDIQNTLRRLGRVLNSGITSHTGNRVLP